MGKTKKVFDSVWGYCEISPLSQMFIDTYEFQRMRNMKQLGVSYFVFPSASGNRFEHSIGVGYLAMTLAEELRKKYPEMVSKRFIELIHIAGLCHDIGHGPFSHIFDDIVSEHDTPNKYHENRSACIVRYMVRKYKIPLEKEEVDFICDTFKPSNKNKNDWKYQIISRDTVDVDRLDYVIRDTRNIGIQVNFSKYQARNMITYASIKDGQIVFEDCESDIEDLLSSRRYLYERIYNHHASEKIKKMLIKVFRSVESLFHFKRSVDNIEYFLQLDDSYLNRIYFSSKIPQETRDIITNIYRRKF